MGTKTLADALSAIRNGIIHGKKKVILENKYSKLLMNVLEIMKREGYLDDYKIIDEKRGKIIEVTLSDYINECKAILPRFFIKKDDYLEWEKQYLPAVDTGILIVSTSKGVMTNKEAKGKLGGALIAYVY